MARHSPRDARWHRFRREVLIIRGRRCERCGRAGRLEVHHVTPIEAGGEPYDLGNVEVLCRDCHIAHHRKDRMMDGRGEWHDFVRAG